MRLPLMSLDAFVEYLCQHEGDIVGYAGFSFFQSPLSCWLSSVAGRLVSVDGMSYSFAGAYGPSFPVPRWARLLSYCLEVFPRCPLTGEQVLSILVDVERSAYCVLL